MTTIKAARWSRIIFDFDEERQQVIRILQTNHRDEKSKSKPRIEHEFALMKQLANVRLYSARLYVHLPEDCDNKAELRQRILRKIKEDLPYFPFLDLTGSQPETDAVWRSMAFVAGEYGFGCEFHARP